MVYSKAIFLHRHNIIALESLMVVSDDLCSRKTIIVLIENRYFTDHLAKS